MSSEHIVKSFGQELEQLSRLITEMGGAAESQIDRAVQSVVRRDVGLAGEVIREDQHLDNLEREVDQRAVRALALRQPMASDLREVVSALKIAADLERIGDYAANVAKRAIAMAQTPAMRPVNTLPLMGRLALEILGEVLESFTGRDAERARAAWMRDEELDDLYNGLFRETLTYMMEDPRNISPCAHLLFIAKNIERIGDHATNIAETIYFLVTGQPLAEERPKGDATAFAVVTPGGLDEAGN